MVDIIRENNSSDGAGNVVLGILMALIVGLIIYFFWRGGVGFGPMSTSTTTNNTSTTNTVLPVVVSGATTSTH